MSTLPTWLAGLAVQNPLYHLVKLMRWGWNPSTTAWDEQSLWISLLVPVGLLAAFLPLVLWRWRKVSRGWFANSRPPSFVNRSAEVTMLLESSRLVPASGTDLAHDPEQVIAAQFSDLAEAGVIRAANPASGLRALHRPDVPPRAELTGTRRRRRCGLRRRRGRIRPRVRRRALGLVS
ncbi:hypothetical protein DEJ13_14630 [Curtobacterium sp. MCLR17_007]|uniref:hypothetical protein n=1 Tax=Curtobacterium sp. MCLR17_007 TaxID=2175648 RepID=UPI0011B380BB|nr:hypothetical protein [Curtobacterium sp. MCLR17_007]WIB59664.1 hypothetical protein DEJ13_14630 [Curtobacterium sp. MCLR17_007]